MAKLSIPTVEILKAMEDLGAAAWIGGRWYHGLGRVRSGARAQTLTRRPLPATTRPDAGEVVAMVGLGLVATVTAIWTLRGNKPREEAAPLGIPLIGALKTALVVGGVAASAVERLARPERSPPWLRRAASAGMLVCGLGVAASLVAVAMTRKQGR